MISKEQVFNFLVDYFPVIVVAIILLIVAFIK